MRITIDTRHDSHQEIKKIIGLLQHLIEETRPETNSFEPPAIEPSAVGMMDMFDSSGGQERKIELRKVEPSMRDEPQIEWY